MGVKSRQLLLLKGAMSFYPRKVWISGGHGFRVPLGVCRAVGALGQKQKDSANDKGALTSVCSREQIAAPLETILWVGGSWSYAP